MKTILFLSDYEDEDEYKAVFDRLIKYDIAGFTAKPSDISIRNSHLGTHFYFRGKEIFPNLVVGYSYENDLIPAIKLLKLWQMSGVPVLNNEVTLFCGQNKDISSAMLNSYISIRHLPYYKFGHLPSEEDLHSISFPMVAKPVDGACGRGLFKIDNYTQFKIWYEKIQNELQNYYVQPYIQKLNNEDYRIVVVNHKACYAYSRQGANGSWITNLMKDGTGHVFEITNLHQELIKMAEESSLAAMAPFCGVDIAFDLDKKPFIIEINTCPAIKICKYIPGAADHVEKAYSEYILNELNKHK